MGELTIETPTYLGTWDTDASSIDLGGSAPTPGGPYSSGCPPFPSYTITWRNSATGDTGTCGAGSILRWTFLFGWVCTTEWAAQRIPLTMGDNPITVVLSDPDGQDCILVKRHPDVTPPTVTWTSPSNGALDVPVDATIKVHFSEPIDPSTVTPTTFLLSEQQGVAVDGAVTLDALHLTATFVPSSPLTLARTYDATVTTGIRDEGGGNALGADYRWAFTTASTAGITP